MMKGLVLCMAALALHAAAADDIVIFDAQKGIGQFESKGAKMTKDGLLVKGYRVPLDFLGEWDLSENLDFEFEIKSKSANKSDKSSIRVKIFSELPEGKQKWDGINPFRAVVAPKGEFGVCKLAYPKAPPKDIWERLMPKSGKLKMRATPFSYGDRDVPTMDYGKITRLRMHTWGAPFYIKRVVAKNSKDRKEAACYSMTAEEFFPFIDKYGQYKFAEWPGKIHSDEELKRAEESEAADLAAHPGAPDRDKFGGWLKGPKQEATGHFYVKKIDGKWWLVDPEGNLFWSHGAVRVTPSCAITPLDGREHYFEALPKEGDKMALFYTTKDELLAPYYGGVKKTYDFSAANLYRKYGDQWRQKYAEKAHARLKSWGMNTIANSSDSSIFMMRKTPYIDRFEIKSPFFRGEFGAWWPFRDPFNPKFAENARKNLLDRKEQLNDPWCIGFFVDNEIHWGTPSTLARNVLISDPSTSAKKVFVGDLKAKYGSIEALNKAWKSDYKDWDGIISGKKVPDGALEEDLRAFSAKITEEYFKQVSSAIRELAPNKLYMGCRFAGGANEQVMKIGAKYCDAISINRYAFSLENLKLPKGIDKPIMIGEFHFGALDRGPFHCGLIYTPNQKARAQAYYDYVESALKNPNVIGTHWHQFSDQAATGRFDGENFQVGFTDVCDVPYRETVDKIREIGYGMYGIRANN